MMWESDAQTALGVDAAHGAAYITALNEYAQTCGHNAPAPWRALLYIGTSDAILWTWLRPRLDYARGTAYLESYADHTEMDLPPWGGQTYLLLEAARHLFGDESAPEIHLTVLLQRLRDRGYHVLMGALHEYRGHH